MLFVQKLVKFSSDERGSQKQNDNEIICFSQHRVKNCILVNVVVLQSGMTRDTLSTIIHQFVYSKHTKTRISVRDTNSADILHWHYQPRKYLLPETISFVWSKHSNI